MSEKVAFQGTRVLLASKRVLLDTREPEAFRTSTRKKYSALGRRRRGQRSAVLHHKQFLFAEKSSHAGRKFGSSSSPVLLCSS